MDNTERRIGEPYAPTKENVRRLLETLAPLMHEDPNLGGSLNVKQEEIERVRAILGGVNYRNFNLHLLQVTKFISGDDLYVLAVNNLPVYRSSNISEYASEASVKNLLEDLKDSGLPVEE